MSFGQNVAAAEKGYYCSSDDGRDELIISFHEEGETHTAVLDGNLERRFPARWSAASEILASFQDDTFLATLDYNLTLNILSKAFGLTRMNCIDITDAAHILNTDFGKMASLHDHAKEVEDKNVKLSEELAETKSHVLRGRRELRESMRDANTLRQNNTTLSNQLEMASQERHDLEEQLSVYTANAEQERRNFEEQLSVCTANAEHHLNTETQKLRDEIQSLKRKSERLIKNSRMWQEQIAELKKKLKGAE